MATATVTLVILVLSTTTLATVILINEAQDGLAVCRGTTVLTECITTTSSGFMIWRIRSKVGSLIFDETASVGATGTLGSTTFTLNSIETVSNAVVYTTTASGNITEETNITCSDGDVPQSIDIYIKSSSSPLWAYSACSFSQGSVLLSWHAPSVAAECCSQYVVRLSTNESVLTNGSLVVSVPIETEPVIANVYCIDHVGEISISENMIIDNSIDIEVTIVPLNGSCDAITNYNISWATNPPGKNICTPPITMSTITCTTPSTHQSINNTRSMMCSVPATETLSVNVTVTNAAGLTVMKSSSADILAFTCQKLNSARNFQSGLSTTTGILLIVLSASLDLCFLLIITTIIVVYLVRKRRKGNSTKLFHSTELTLSRQSSTASDNRL